jgi:midasin
MRILRALQIDKPILLEGSPGVGKTSLVQALATELGIELVRVNLSDQTDLADLFGTDMPSRGVGAGEFEFQPAPFLQAMQNGAWVLLDEMNLAPQQVLEGLNSCLDYRRTVYLPELDKTFHQAPGFRVFAAQNPLKEGGARKGLPRSFLDRFAQVWVDKLTPSDLLQICGTLYPSLDAKFLQSAVTFTSLVASQAGKLFAQSGAPWDVNLRDMLRWFHMLSELEDLPIAPLEPVEPGHQIVDLIFLQRFRTPGDRQHVRALYKEAFGHALLVDGEPRVRQTKTGFQIGGSAFASGSSALAVAAPRPGLNQSLRALAHTLSSRNLAIVVGGRACGKSALVERLANMTGRRLQRFYASSQTDSLDLLGAFEQTGLLKAVRAQLGTISMALKNRCDIDQSEDFGSCLETLARHVSTGSEESEDDLSLIKGSLAHLLAVLPPNLLPPEEQSQLHRLSEGGSNASESFAWVDGPVVRAMKEGTWFLVEDANLCPSSVLDRLNSMFDTAEGSLLLNERGTKTTAGEIEVVRPHPDFRLVMTINPEFGELSRAMRNRGIEIFLPARLIDCTPPPLQKSSSVMLLKSATPPADFGRASRRTSATPVIASQLCGGMQFTRLASQWQGARLEETVRGILRLA